MQFAGILEEDEQSNYLYLLAVWLVRESTSSNCFLSLYMGYCPSIIFFLFSYTYELLFATEAPEEMFQFGGDDVSQRNTKYYGSRSMILTGWSKGNITITFSYEVLRTAESQLLLYLCDAS